MKIVGEYILKEKIGKGSYGEVYLTSKNNSNETYATKELEKEKVMGPILKRYFVNEMEILKILNHPNIMQLVDIQSRHNYIYLITEYCNGGTLSENLTKYQKLHKTPLPEKIVIYLMKQISDAINYLHEKSIIHRDLKMENILLHFENLDDKKKLNLLKAKVKIIDFGFARYLNNNSHSPSIVGSALTMAPDILHALADPSWHKNLKYNEKADIYSLGVIMFILLIGKPPFNAGDYKELFSKVNFGIYSIPKDLKLSKQCITLMNGMLMQESEKRFSILEVFRSDFLMKPYEKFEMIDFSEFENSNKNNNFVIEQNEKNIFLDIKQMISFDNQKQPQKQLDENINSINKENMNVILNDMNNKDEELEMLLEQLKNNKIESFNQNNIEFYSSNSDINNNNNNNNNNNVMPLQEIFEIPIQKLENIFDMINKRFEMFQMEAIPIYFENPKLYENFIL